MYADEQPNFLHINQQVATPSFTFTTKSLGSASKAPQHHQHSQSRHDHDADEVPTSLYRTSVSRAAAAPSEARSVGYGGDEPSWRARSVMVGDDDDMHPSSNRHASFSERFSSVLSAPLPASLQTSSRGALPAHHQHAAAGRGSSANHSHNGRAGSAASTSRAVVGGKPHTVHDSLYEQGRLYKAMREELQAKAAKEELKKVTGSPSVSRYANEKAMERRKRLGRPEDVVERMEAATNAARAKTDKKRQEVLERRRRQQEEEDFGITSAASEDESCFGDVTMPTHDNHNHSRHHQSTSKGSRRASSAAALRAASGGGGDHGAGPRKSILRAGSTNRPATRTLSFSPGAKARTISGGVSRPASNVSPGHQRTGSSRRRTRTPFQPRLTEKGRNAEAKVTAPEYLAQHQHRAQQRADAHRTDRLLKDLQQCRDVPEITLRSKELTQRRAEREGTAGLSYIDAMLERDRLSKEALAQKAEQRRIEENHFHPRITAYAATLGQQGSGGDMEASSVMRASQQSHAERARMDVAERLYADSFAMEERRAERARKIDGHRTNNKASSRTSSVNREEGGGGAPRVPVGDRLLRQHEEAMRERQRRIVEEDELTRLTSRPAIDPVSAAITARLPETAQERLLGSRSGANSSRFQQQQYGEAVMESRTMPPRRVLSQEEEERMLYKLHNYDERRREKLRQLQSEREEEELAECTFRPNTTNTYYTGETHFDSASSPSAEDADRNHMHFTQFDTQALADQENRDPEPKQSSWRDVSIVERNAQWAAQRNARLEAQRSELKDKEVEGCTFKPEVQSGRNPPATSSAAPQSNKHTDPLDPRSSVSTGRSASTPGTIYGGDGTPWGVHEYLARQQYARYLQLEKEYKLTGKRPPPPPQPFDPAAMYQANDDVDMEGSIVSSSTEGNRPSLSPHPRGDRGGYDTFETESTTTRSAPSLSQRPPTHGGPIASLRPPSGPGDVRGLLDVSHDFGEEDGSLSHRRGGSLLVPPSMR